MGGGGEACCCGAMEAWRLVGQRPGRHPGGGGMGAAGLCMRESGKRVGRGAALWAARAVCGGGGASG